MERGSKYEAYAKLRESRLRMKQTKNQPEKQDYVTNLIPAKKPVKFQGQKSFQATTNIRGKGAGWKAQSAPNLVPVVEKYAAPPAKNCSKLHDIGSRSVPVEKRKNGLFTAIRSSRRAMQTWIK